LLDCLKKIVLPDSGGCTLPPPSSYAYDPTSHEGTIWGASSGLIVEYKECPVCSQYAQPYSACGSSREAFDVRLQQIVVGRRQPNYSWGKCATLQKVFENMPHFT